MITGNDSWKYLVVFFVVLAITIGAGCCASMAGTAGKVFGVLNMILGVFWVVKTYLKYKDKE